LGGDTSTPATTAATATGGTSATGGTKATGGTSSATGGTKATGGTSSATGGTKATGGTSSTGGTTAASTGTYDTSISTGEFSFFVISPMVIKANSPSITCSSELSCTNSLGGNLGGLAGADALCTKAAQAANPGDNHQWRAFLSTSTVNAKDRIGTGPWYSAPPEQQNKTNYASEGLLFGSSLSEITSKDRPGDSTTIVWTGSSPSGVGMGTSYNWPFNTCYLDETGVCTTEYGDSHDTNTGSTTTGTFAGASNACSDWTSAASNVKSKNGHSWCRSSDCRDMNWISSSNESHPCLGIINMTTSNGSTGIGSGGGYGGFYCFAVSN
jgi:hypothetical protein